MGFKEKLFAAKEAIDNLGIELTEEFLKSLSTGELNLDKAPLIIVVAKASMVIDQMCAKVLADEIKTAPSTKAESGEH